MKNSRRRNSPAVHLLVRLLVAVMLACLLTLTVFCAPLIRSAQNDAPISVPQYLHTLRSQRPAAQKEGLILHAGSSAAVETLPEKTEFDDGLDLDQTIEGQFTVLFLGFDSETNGSGHLHDVNYLIQFRLQPAGLHILQIPRDTYMPGYAENSTAPTRKFNSIYACGDPSVSGIQRVVNAVEESFGVPVDAYVTTGCDDLAEIVDIIGGVPVDMPYRLEFEPGKVIEAGEQTLNGEQAAWLLRYRQGYAMGDIGRIQAQRIFMAAVMEKVSAMPKLQMLAALRQIFSEELVATDLRLEDLARLADLAGTIQTDEVGVFLLPGESAMLDDQDMWSVHKRAALELINAQLRTYQAPLLSSQSTLTEIVTEEHYRSTQFDDDAATLQDAGLPVLKQK